MLSREGDWDQLPYTNNKIFPSPSEPFEPLACKRPKLSKERVHRLAKLALRNFCGLYKSVDPGTAISDLVDYSCSASVQTY
jgi:hypothetical protein